MLQCRETRFLIHGDQFSAIAREEAKSYSVSKEPDPAIAFPAHKRAHLQLFI
jgi:hypothetical protein